MGCCTGYVRFLAIRSGPDELRQAGSRYSRVSFVTLPTIKVFLTVGQIVRLLCIGGQRILLSDQSTGMHA
jgi:hypothetical protein